MDEFPLSGSMICLEDAAMSDPMNQQTVNETGSGSQSPVKPRVRRQPQKTPPRVLPPWKVMLHNDDVNDREDVVRIIRQLTPLSKPEAVARMNEADQTGVALLLVTHRERAEQQRIGHREDGRVEPDPEAERQHGDDGEARAP